MNREVTGCGIYRLRNAVNGKVYIGQSNDIARRYMEHRKSLRKNKHYNGFLQNAWNKHGEAMFVLEIIELAAVERLDDLERAFIANARSAEEDFGYNISVEPGHGFRRGMKNSPSHRKAISDAKKGKPGPLHTDESKDAIRVALIGLAKSPEHCAAISKAGVGKPACNKGIAHSQSAKDKMSATKASYKWRGELLTLRAIATRVGMVRATLAARMKMGMSLEQAVATPLHALRCKDENGKFIAYKPT